MIMRFVLTAAVLACAGPAPAPALAMALDEPVRVAVLYGDLDLTSDAGREALDTRHGRAARKVCGNAPARELRQITARQVCHAKARTGYRAQVALTLDAANARRVAVLADKIYLLASF
jgi:UrcA family protein